jgi:dihydroorotase
MLGLQRQIGALRPGHAGDITVLADERGRWALRDNENTQVIANRMLRPIFCLRGGEYFTADAAILPVARAA